MLSMRALLKGFKLSLISYVSLAFVFFLLVSTSTLVTVNYYRTSTLAFEAALAQFDHAIKLEKQNFKKYLKPAAFRLSLHARKNKWQDFSAYQKNSNLLYELANYIAIDPLSNAIHIGFKNGNFVSVRQLLNARDRRQSQAPQDARFLFEVQEYSPDGLSKVKLTFLNSQQEAIAPPTVTSTSYKIFDRPWYRKGLMAKEIALVAPYQEYEEEHRIISLVLNGKNSEVVHAIDLNVLAVSELMQASHVTDRDLQVLISSEDEILAYQFSGELKLSEMGKPVASANKHGYQAIVNFANKDENQAGLNELVLNGEVWVAKVALLNPNANIGTKLLIAAPKVKILDSAKKSLFGELVLSGVVILLFIPFTWLFARVLVRPLKRLLQNTHQLAGLHFNQVSLGHSFIAELSELEQDVLAVSHSLEDTFSILSMLAKERNINVLAEKICSQACGMLKADAAFIFLSDEGTELKLKPAFAWGNNQALDLEQFTPIDLGQELVEYVEIFLQGEVQFLSLSKSLKVSLVKENIYQNNQDVYTLFIPLLDREEKIKGLLGFNFTREISPFERGQYIGIAKALSEFISVAIEGNALFESQKQLMKSFIRLIAGAIDTKSPYTGAHCQRVPTLTMMLAEEATKSEQANLDSFTLSDEQWSELKIAAWLHDCGKVTTPENVVDKATKLETIYNRIHEVRMRFEVLHRDAHIDSLQKIIAGEDKVLAEKYLAQEISALKDDFAFIAQCNLGEEMISADAVTRIGEISQRKWLRYFDDTLGLSSAERARKPVTNAQLPIEESLLADKAEHCIEHMDCDLPQEFHSKFTMEVPKYRFDLGELNNLAISRGTINDEERYIINHHIVQTIEMLEQLPFPDNLKRVPEIAGAHHEHLNGKGYPKGLKGDEISIEARILAIADVFEALTASDRPYKDAKSLSQSIAIMDYMRKTEHIDNDLFELFLSSGVYMDYAKQFLKKEQIDKVDIKQYLSS